MTDKDLEALSPLSQALLELERTRPVPSDAPDVIWGKVGTTLGQSSAPTPAPTGGPVATTAASSAAVVGAGKLAFGVAMLMLGGLMGGGLVAVIMRGDQPASTLAETSTNRPAQVSGPQTTREPEPTTASATNEAATVTAEVPPRVEGKNLPAKTRPGTQVRRDVADAGSVEAKDEGDSSLKAERSLVEPARTALARRNIGEALALLNRHETEFPNGQLAEEREGLLIQCLVNSGKGTEARIRADDFRRRFPRSILLPAVDAVVESISVTDSGAHPK